MLPNAPALRKEIAPPPPLLLHFFALNHSHHRTEEADLREIAVKDREVNSKIEGIGALVDSLGKNALTLRDKVRLSVAGWLLS